MKLLMLTFAVVTILWASILIIAFLIGLIKGLKKRLKARRTIRIDRKHSNKNWLN